MESSSLITLVRFSLHNINNFVQVFQFFKRNRPFLFLGSFPGSSDGKASAYNAEDPGSIPGSGRSPGEGNGNPLQYSCLENPMDRGAWWATIHRVTKSRTRLSDFCACVCDHFSLLAGKSFDITVSPNQGNNRCGSQHSQNTLP